MEHCRQPRTSTEPEHHVAQLADRAIGEHTFDVGLHKGKCGGNHDGDGRNDHDDIRRRAKNVEAGEEHRVEARHEKHAGYDHR